MSIIYTVLAIVMGLGLGYVAAGIFAKRSKRKDLAQALEISDKRFQEKRNRMKVIQKDALHPDTRIAFEKGEMTDKQMADLLSSCGWDASVDGNKVVVNMPQVEYIYFGPIARERLKEQAQYASRAIDGRNGFPNLGEGLRFQGNPSDYHSVKIHEEDVEEFVRRWNDWQTVSEAKG